MYFVMKCASYNIHISIKVIEFNAPATGSSVIIVFEVLLIKVEHLHSSKLHKVYSFD